MFAYVFGEVRLSLSVQPTSLNVAIVTGSVSRKAGGLFNSVRRTALTLAAAGHRVTVIGHWDDYAEVDLQAWGPLVPVIVPRSLPLPGASSVLGSLLREGRFDVVHQHGIWQPFSSRVAAWGRYTRSPVMISPRGMLDPWAVRHHAWKKYIAGLLYEHSNLRCARCLHALNESEAAALREFGLKNPIAVIPNGADQLVATRQSSDRPTWWPEDKRVLLFIGRIHPKKGLQELVNAWACVVRTAPDIAARWRVVIAGWDDGGHEATLRELVTRHDLGRDIIMPGALYGAEKEMALQGADAFVLPSFSEGSPMSVLEAWAAGLPVFMTRACNLDQGFAAKAALEVDTDPTAMACVFVRHLPDDNLQTYGAIGRKLVLEHFSWDRLTLNLIDVYRWLTSGGQPPSTVQLS